MDFKSDMQARIQEIEAALQTYIPKQEAFPPVTVSYTHLTLPTIA